MSNNETKKCPYCGEEILAVAKKCKHCGTWLDGSAEPTSNPSPVVNKKNKLLPVAVVVAIIAIVGAGYLLLSNGSDGNAKEDSAISNKIDRKYYDAQAFGFNGHVKTVKETLGNKVGEYTFDSDGTLISFNYGWHETKVDPTSIQRDSNGFLMAVKTNDGGSQAEFSFNYENGKLKRTVVIEKPADSPEEYWSEKIFEIRTLSTGATMKNVKSTMGVKNKGAVEYHYYPTSEYQDVLVGVDDKGNPQIIGQTTYTYEYWE